MTRQLRLLCCVLLLDSLASGAQAQSEKNVLTNGDFEQLDVHGDPVGWKMAPPNTRISTENGNHYLVVDRLSPNTGTSAEQAVSVNPFWVRLRVSARVRGRGIRPGKEVWQCLQLGIRFLDAKGAALGYGGFTIREDTDWKEMVGESEIPAGSKSFQVYPSSFGEAGELAIDNIRIVALTHQQASDGVLPDGEKLSWGEEPVEVLSPARGEIVLNGLWRFQPGIPGAKEPATAGWGYIRVPGSWRNGYSSIGIPGVVGPGSGPAWETWRSDSLNLGWYKRPIRVPADWQGRAIVLGLERVSTDAWVYVDGQEAGRVGWPSGEVDITRLVIPGREQRLLVFVAAISAQEQVGTFMGPGNGQISFDKAKLESKGLVDDVVLRSRPLGAHVSDVFVQPSMRRKEVTLTIELAEVKQAGPVRFTAYMDRKGKAEKTFERTVMVEAAPVQTLMLSWPWPDPALWDLDQPNLYTLKLSADGAGLSDVYIQPFGFREFWAEGRKFFLNGTEFRLRPQVMPEQWSSVSGTRELIDGSLKGLRWAGYNIAELWPYPAQRRGQHHFHEAICDAADRLGFPLMGSAGSMNDFIFWGRPAWKDREEWERLTRLELRRLRNHPSILVWTSSGNVFGHAHDQHPQALGQDNWYSDAGLRRRAGVIETGLTFMRHIDPTRPAFIHQGILGDLYAVNNYLDFTPLQEREEWLSTWSESGKKPYLAVEFGTPFSCSFQRGRGGFDQAITTEPLVSEFAATYLGPEAYRMETPAYRTSIREHFGKDQLYRSWGNAPELNFAPATQAIEDLFVRNTWRSWRTWGITAGMVPWIAAYGWETVHHEEVNAPPFQPGRRGTYSSRLPKEYLFALRPEGGLKLHPAAQALMANNAPTLAYVAGAPPVFTDKQHAFWASQNVAKQVVLINDERRSQPYEMTWQVNVGGKQIANGSKSGLLGPACNLLVPFSFGVPSVTVKTDGVIEVSAKIGTYLHTDRLPFRIFPHLTIETGKVVLFDPVGKTTAMLKHLGLDLQQWDGRPSSTSLLVIGREALSGEVRLPGSLKDFVQKGGRALIFAQQPADMERLWGLRVSRHISRRVFAVSPDHPVTAGLDATDLRDWAGASDLLPDKEPLPEMNVEPPYGWHWGNRGGVASAAVEKPHLSGWRPILECEFDSAYSPLMELDYGHGRLMLCLLDLEGRTATEPCADQLARSLLRYAQTAPLRPRASSVVVLGTAPGWFDLLGVQAAKARSLPDRADLVLIAADTTVDEKALTTYIERGGRAVFLPRRSARAPLGLALEKRLSAGSLDVPKWEIAAGLSPSDLRWRTETTAWLVQSGAEISAGGQLALKQIGKGLAAWLQLDPDQFDADQQTYFRFTRWRQTRAVAQVLANFGVTLRADASVFAFRPQDAAHAPTGSTAPSFYHPDYRADFLLGDDPFRYKRW